VGGKASPPNPCPPEGAINPNNAPLKRKNRIMTRGSQISVHSLFGDALKKRTKIKINRLCQGRGEEDTRRHGEISFKKEAIAQGKNNAFNAP